MKWWRRARIWLRRLFTRPARKLRVRDVAELPEKLNEGLLYVAGENGYRWFAAMVCPCGCGDMLHDLFTPLDGQESEAVKAYGFEVMRQLTEALMGSWKSGGNGEFFQELRARVAMPTRSGQGQAQMP